MDLVLELACVVVGAALQGITGFGFALFAAPLLGAIAGPQAAVSELAVLGLLLNLGVLGRRERQVDSGEVRRLLAWALPALVLGVVLLGVLPRDPVLAIVGVSAILGAVLLARERPDPRPIAAGRRAPGPVLAGVSSGLLTTLTGTNGPPLVVHLLARGASPTVFRDTLAALFVVLDGAAIVALLIAGAWDTGAELVALVVAAGVGLAAGRGLHDRLSGETFRHLTLTLLVVSGLVALAHAAT